MCGARWVSNVGAKCDVLLGKGNKVRGSLDSREENEDLPPARGWEISHVSTVSISGRSLRESAMRTPHRAARRCERLTELVKVAEPILIVNFEVCTSAVAN